MLLVSFIALRLYVCNAPGCFRCHFEVSSRINNSLRWTTSSVFSLVECFDGVRFVLSVLSVIGISEQSHDPQAWSLGIPCPNVRRGLQKVPLKNIIQLLSIDVLNKYGVAWFRIPENQEEMLLRSKMARVTASEIKWVWILEGSYVAAHSTQPVLGNGRRPQFRSGLSSRLST